MQKNIPTVATCTIVALLVMEILALVLAVVLNVAALAVGHKHSSPFDSLRHERAKVKLENRISFSVSPSILSKSGDWVTVSWQEVEYPNSSDWIGVYSPPIDDIYRIDPVNHSPIKFQYASYSPKYLSKGYGSLKFRLINMRQRVIFGFFRGGFEYPLLVAVSNVVRFKNWNEPLQAHLALTGDPTEMVLQWVTKRAKLPVVYWGSVSQAYENTKIASTSTYNASHMCGSPATDFGYRDPGMLHRVTMEGLTPGMKYYYIFGDNYGWSEEFSFTAAPAQGFSGTIRLIAYGDMGCGEVDESYQMYSEQPSINTTNHIQEQLDEIDFVMHIGDISYAQGYSSVWDTFFDQIQPIASAVPYMVCIGNHERNWPYSSPGYFNNTDSGGECGVPHEMRFPMPRPSLDHPWYSFDYGSVHFLVMSTEHDFRKGSLQYDYIGNDLASVNRSITPWLVVTGHRPMYVASTDDNWPDGHLPVAELLQESLEPLLIDYKVDLAMWAHHHSYQRTCPVYQEVCTEEATIHVVIGMAGRDLSTDLVPYESPDWIEFEDYNNYGYTRLAANATTLVFEFIRNEDNEVYDTLILEKFY